MVISDKLIKLYLKHMKSDKFRFLHSKDIIKYNIEQLKFKRNNLKIKFKNI